MISLLTSIVAMADDPVLPLWLSIMGGILFLSFVGISFWLYQRSINNRKPKHVTEGYPFFKRAFAEGMPTLWICLGVMSLLTSIAFFATLII